MKQAWDKLKIRVTINKMNIEDLEECETSALNVKRVKNDWNKIKMDFFKDEAKSELTDNSIIKGSVW